MDTLTYLLARAKEFNITIPPGLIMDDIRIVTGVAPKTLTVRNAPAKSGKVLGSLPEGAQVTVLDSIGDWVMIRAGEWVNSNYLKRQ